MATTDNTSSPIQRPEAQTETSANPQAAAGLIYGLNDRPPLRETLLLRLAEQRLAKLHWNVIFSEANQLFTRLSVGKV